MTIKTLRVEIPFAKRNDPDTVVTTITKHIPLPPNINIDSDRVVPYSQNLEKEDAKKAEEAIQNLIKSKLSTKNISKDEKSQWQARAMKRNPELLSLYERVRPLSGKKSFSRGVFEKYNSKRNIPHVSTTENRAVLSREQLIQILHQHLILKGYHETSKMLALETGVKYNGEYENAKTSILRTLITMGVQDESKIFSLPESTNLSNLDEDVEVQTASIYHHLDIGIFSFSSQYSS